MSDLVDPLGRRLQGTAVLYDCSSYRKSDHNYARALATHGVYMEIAPLYTTSNILWQVIPAAIAVEVRYGCDMLRPVLNKDHHNWVYEGLRIPRKGDWFFSWIREQPVECMRDSQVSTIKWIVR